METYDVVNDDIRPEEKRVYWDTAFGLQAVDGLSPSGYLVSLADEHVAGKKTYQEVDSEIRGYYHNASQQSQNDVIDTEREADFVSDAIYAILSDKAFTFSPMTLKSYHRRLFERLPERIFHPGDFRTVNLTKKEPILDGDTVSYQDYGLIEDSLKYDFSEETGVDYLGLSDAEKIASLVSFTSRIWQVHPFMEGNTRTTAVFIEKYLRSMGFVVNNELFKNHSLFFRNALVRANYSNIPKHVSATNEYLIQFFENLLLDAHHELDNARLKI